MTEHYYTCTLLSDVVVNASLATEGNMSSLDYIPGSTFMGIVANPLYKEFKEESERLLPILHEGKVRFGDANISFKGQQCLPMPFQFFTDKEKKDLEKDPVYLGHFLEEKEVKDDLDNKIQPQQVRLGYVSVNGANLEYLTAIPKNFSLKSAHNRDTRTANDSQMFGLEALPRGMQLLFSIQYDHPEYITWVEKHLIGIKRLGKSKSAEFGQAEIKKYGGAPQAIPTFDLQDGVLVYAASHLCFYNEKGFPIYQPKAEDLGFEAGEICWEKSQIRTFNYTTWNTTRQTTNAIRYCIARGSVFFVKGVKTNQPASTVGEWQTEGLGRVIFNPEFLKGDSSKATSLFSGKFSKMKWEDLIETKSKSAVNDSPLIRWLRNKQAEKNDTLNLSDSVQKAIYGDFKKMEVFDKVTSSQWGQIRQLANAAKTKEELALSLFDHPKKRSSESDGQHKSRKGHLMHGVAYDRIWSQQREMPIKALKEIFEIQMDDNPEEHSKVIRSGKSKEFITLFAAEMAHRYIRMKNRKDHE